MSNPITQTDATFLKRFAMLIGFLMFVALLLGILASYIYSKNPPPPRPNAEKVVAERIAPAGGVYAGDTGRAAMQAAKEAADKAAASQVAYGGTTDGKTIYGNLCHSCHDTGAGGAPKITDKSAWASRVAEGEATLLKHATEGFTGSSGTMPPKGGNPALSDEQIKATVEYMLSQVK